jgi:hypothetical protein
MIGMFDGPKSGCEIEFRKKVARKQRLSEPHLPSWGAALEPEAGTEGFHFSKREQSCCGEMFAFGLGMNAVPEWTGVFDRG